MNKFDVFSNKFSHDIFLQKYSMDGQETWSDMCKRVVTAVCGQLLSKEDQEEIYNIMLNRKFIPGGRYLYSSGRSYHPTNNCFLFRAEDSREGWGDLLNKVSLSLMSGGGIGVDYSSLRPANDLIKKTGGRAGGPIGLMRIVNESGRQIMNGGNRRSAIWAGLNWAHKDAFDFLSLKNWSEDLKNLKGKNLLFPLDMEFTNISLIYDTEFFIAIENKNHPKHEQAKLIWNKNCLQAFSTAEPGFSFNFCKDNESLRNACQPGFAKIELANGSTKTMAEVQIGDILLNINKKETQVIKKWSNGLKPVFAFQTKNNDVFVGTKDHKIIVQNNDGSWIKQEIYKAYSENNPILGLKGYSQIISQIYLGLYEVFDITVNDDTHTYITNGVVASNCTEVVSEDDSDKCNLGTIWINRIDNKKELRNVVKYATKFLMCGGIYSDVPTEKIKEVGTKNNRIGLGLGGMHEWLIARGEDYQVTSELHKWLSIYEQESNSTAFITAKELQVSVPKGIRAIAPTGTIGTLAETTTGIEPLFCKAYKRRYLKDNKWFYQYVVDGTVKRLLDQGIKLEDIKDSYDLTFKQRVKFQADVQNYVDMAISSTCNLPKWGSVQNNETTLKENSEILLKYAKRLRGFTCYPDASRQGQPLERVDLQLALNQEGVVFEEIETSCVNGVCGI